MDRKQTIVSEFIDSSSSSGASDGGTPSKQVWPKELNPDLDPKDNQRDGLVFVRESTVYGRKDSVKGVPLNVKRQRPDIYKRLTEQEQAEIRAANLAKQQLKRTSTHFSLVEAQVITKSRRESLVGRVVRNSQIIDYRGQFVKDQANKMSQRLNKSIRVTKETMGNYLNSLHQFEESAKHKLDEINEEAERRASRIERESRASTVDIPGIAQRASLVWQKRNEEGK